MFWRVPAFEALVAWPFEEATTRKVQLADARERDVRSIFECLRMAELDAEAADLPALLYLMCKYGMDALLSCCRLSMVDRFNKETGPALLRTLRSYDAESMKTACLTIAGRTRTDPKLHLDVLRAI